MVTFSNPFLSVAGQKERISNVGATLLSSITGKGVTADTGSKTGNKILGYAASNPLTTAALITPINTIGAVKAGFTALSSGGKVAAVVGGVAGVGAVASNPKLLSKAGEIPTKITSLGSDVGTATLNPTKENLLAIYKNQPIIAGGLTAAGLGLIGKGLVGAGASVSNTLAIKEQTEAYKDYTAGLEQAAAGLNPQNNQSPLYYSAGDPVAASRSYPEAATGLVSYSDKPPVVARMKKRKSKTIYRSPINIRNNILIANRN